MKNASRLRVRNLTLCRSLLWKNVPKRKGHPDKAKALKMMRDKKLRAEGKADMAKAAAHTVAGDVIVPLLYSSDPEHWQKRAEDTRALARFMSDPVAEEMLIEIANNYDRIALRAVERRSQKA
jgi:hypothetical protein